MLKEAIEKIEDMAKPVMQVIGDATFAITTDGEAHEIRPIIDHPETLDLTSLDALVKMIQTFDAKNITPQRLYIAIPDHLTVSCFTHCSGKDDHYFRQRLYTVNATDVPGWDTKVQLPFEEAQIALRTRFQETQDTAYTLRLLSEITAGAKLTLNDNGIATTVVSQKGVALQGNETIRPIVKLRPYRTFQEVEQPESTFLIRVNERSINFIEADGGMWKLKARETVKAFLEDKLSAEVGKGDVVVAL